MGLAPRRADTRWRATAQEGQTVQGDPMSQINQTGRRIIYVMMVVVVLVVIWQILTPL